MTIGKVKGANTMEVKISRYISLKLSKVLRMREIALFDVASGSMIRVGDKDEAQSIIKALENAITDGWFEYDEPLENPSSKLIDIFNTTTLEPLETMLLREKAQREANEEKGES